MSARLSARLPTLLLLAGTFGACSVYDPTLLTRRDATSEGGAPDDTGETGSDGGSPDGDADFDGVTPDEGEGGTMEGGPDDARDGSSDGCSGRMCGTRCVDVQTDPTNCGVCGMRCDLLSRVRADAVRCVAGSCVLDDACQVGYANCNSTEPGMGISDGCESQVSLDTRCGGCNTMCSGATPRCQEVPIASGGDAGVSDAGQDGGTGDAGDGGSVAPTTRFACTNGCAVSTPDRCGMNCVALQTDVANCGMCGVVCRSAEHAAAACTSGACALRCDDGFGNCDTTTSNGCESALMTSVTHCGTCGNACPMRPSSSPRCTAGACGITCNPGTGDCNTMAEDGCESTFATDVMNCGACGTACTAPSNGTAVCAAGSCSARCNAGFVLMDGMCVGSPLRQLGPLSTTTVTRLRPTLRWALAGGADGGRVEICRDRACASLVGAFDAPGASGAPAFDVPVGVNYWRVRGRMGTPGNFVTGASPAWQFIVPRRIGSTPPDSSYGSRLDINLDGFSDLVVGAYGAASNAGRVFVYLGTASGLPSAPNTTLQPTNASDTLFGRNVANLGDVNGDGYSDVGVVTFSGSKVFVYHGGPSGLGTGVATTIGPISGAITLGSSLAGVGDVNGDGYGDMVVGASGSGTAHLFFGSATGITTATSVRLLGNTSSQFGASVAGPGDVNGDGLADIVVGAPAESFVYAYLTSAPLSITPTSARVILMGQGRAGAAMASAGDVNADGYPDIVVGEPDLSQVRVWRGGPGGFDPSPPAPLTISGNAGFGSAVAGGADVNGDGYDDIVVGAQAASRAFVFRGNSARTDSAPNPIIDGVSGQGFGISVAMPGDTDGNGTGEVVGGINSPVGFRLYRSSPGTFPTGDSSFNPPGVVGGTGNFGSAFGY